MAFYGKTLRRLLRLSVSVLFLAACSAGGGTVTDSGTGAGNGTGTGGGVRPGDGVSYTQEGMSARIRGVDASMVQFTEKHGGIYKYADGTPGDFFRICKAYGVNWARFRLWVDPHSYAAAEGPADNYARYPQGLCDLETVQALARRAEAAGLRWLLDFHYSDTWTHPGQQIVPASWSGIAAGEPMAEKIASYTTEVLQELKSAGLVPDMVQVGNEVNSGMCVGATSDRTNLQMYLEAGCRAVKEFDSGIRVMIHIARGGDASLRNFFSAGSGGYGNSWYDVIGLSWYPWYTDHGTIRELGENIRYFAGSGKEVVVAETSWPWTNGWKDWTDNVCGASSADAAGAYQQDAADNLQYPGIVMDGGIPAASPAGQRSVVEAVMEVTRVNGGWGVFYWGGEWIAYGAATPPPDGSTWENQALFDFDGRPLDVLNAFSR